VSLVKLISILSETVSPARAHFASVSVPGSLGLCAFPSQERKKGEDKVEGNYQNLAALFPTPM